MNPSSFGGILSSLCPLEIDSVGPEQEPVGFRSEADADKGIREKWYVAGDAGVNGSLIHYNVLCHQHQVYLCVDLSSFTACCDTQLTSMVSGL